MDPPRARGEDEVVVDVLAAGLHPRVRSDASGSHYTSSGALPLVPGIDGVGRLPDGRRVYFVVHDTPLGTMAEQTVLDRRRCVELPDGVDDAEIAAAMNPAMSSWIALCRRVAFEPGQRVLVLGATGNAGQMAVQIAKRLGAGAVIGAGRNRERLGALAALGADAVVSLDGDPDGRDARASRGRRRSGRGPRLSLGPTRRAGDAGAVDRALRQKSALELDSDRIDRRPDDRAAVGGAALGEHQRHGERPRLGVGARHPARAARARRRDRRRNAGGQRAPRSSR